MESEIKTKGGEKEEKVLKIAGTELIECRGMERELDGKDIILIGDLEGTGPLNVLDKENVAIVRGYGLDRKGLGQEEVNRERLDGKGLDKEVLNVKRLDGKGDRDRKFGGSRYFGERI